MLDHTLWQGIEKFVAVWEHKLRCKKILPDLTLKDVATLVIWYRGRGGVCVCVCLAYTSEDFHMKTLRHTEDSTPSEDPKTGPRKTLAKNAENVMFYHLRGVRAPRTSMDFQPCLIYEDIRVLGSISKASRCVCVCGGGCVCVFCFLFCFVLIFGHNWKTNKLKYIKVI